MYLIVLWAVQQATDLQCGKHIMRCMQPMHHSTLEFGVFTRSDGPSLYTLAAPGVGCCGGGE